VEIAYFTDPLCCWSWAMEPHWRRLRMAFAAHDGIVWRVRMGGMLADWERFGDPVHDVCTPAQMAPYWYQVRREHGVPLDERLWLEDPPASSYPASVAYHAALAQGAEPGERYLRRLREAAMLERRNVARRAVLEALASEIAAADLDFDVQRFAAALDDPTIHDAFRGDLREARWLGVTRFPALVIRRTDDHAERRPAILILGHRPFSILHAAMLEVLGEASRPPPAPPDVRSYLARWGSVTRWELATALDASDGTLSPEVQRPPSERAR